MPQEQGTRESREECVARMLRNGASWRMIQEECGVSKSTISRIKRRIEGGDKGATGSVLWDAELNAKAIELIRKGKARTPADLVEHLGIPIPQVVELFNAAATAMRMTVYDIVELSKKVDEIGNKVLGLTRGLDKRISEASDIYEKLGKVIPILLEKEKTAEGMVKMTSSLLGELNRAINVINSERAKEVEKAAEMVSNAFFILYEAGKTAATIGVFRAITCEHYDMIDRRCEIREQVLNAVQKMGGDLKSLEDFLGLPEPAVIGIICTYCPYYKQKDLETLRKQFKQVEDQVAKSWGLKH